MKTINLRAGLLAGGALLLAAGVTAPTATRAQSGDTEAVDAIVVTGRLANASISGIDIAPLRLPQNVRALDVGLIQDLAAARIDDLLDLSGSVARQNNFGGLWDNYAIRGFSGDINGGPDLLINRFNANRGFNAARDVATIEVFQVLKGPASALSGKGEPGGSINIVTKAPTGRDHLSTLAEVGSFDHYRGSLDGGVRLSDSASVRMIAAAEDNGSFRDFVGSDRILLAPSIAFAPSDGLRLLYQLEYSKVHTVFDRGVAALPSQPGSTMLDGKALPRTRFLGEPGDGEIRLQSIQHQASFTADLASGVALEGGLQYRDGDVYGVASEPTSRVGTSIRRRRQLRDNAFEDLSGRLEIAARGAMAGVEHQFRVGVDAYRFDLDQRGDRATTAVAGGPYAIDALVPVYGQPLPTPLPNSNTSERQRGEGVYAQDLISFSEQVSLLVGVRHDRIRQSVLNNRTGGRSQQTVSVTSPRAALTYKPTESVSLYGSWGQSFRFNQGVDAQGAAFDPERGHAYEAGLKYALMDGRVTGTLSAFRITKSNILASDPALTGFSIAVGRARSQGLEADVNLSLGRFEATAVYALVDTEILKDDVVRAGPQPIPVGTELSNIPRHSASVFGQWRSSDAASGFLTLSAGASYVGEREGTPAGAVTGGGVFRLPGYVTTRAGLGYQLTPVLSAQLSVENIFDAHYLASSYNELWVMPGAPRTVRLRVQADF